MIEADFISSFVFSYKSKGETGVKLLQMGSIIQKKRKKQSVRLAEPPEEAQNGGFSLKAGTQPQALRIHHGTKPISPAVHILSSRCGSIHKPRGSPGEDKTKHHPAFGSRCSRLWQRFRIPRKLWNSKRRSQSNLHVSLLWSQEIIHRICLFLAGHTHFSSEPTETPQKPLPRVCLRDLAWWLCACLGAVDFDLIAVSETTVQLVKHKHRAWGHRPWFEWA